VTPSPEYMIYITEAKACASPAMLVENMEGKVVLDNLNLYIQSLSINLDPGDRSCSTVGTIVL
jgi:hypothetical protein